MKKGMVWTILGLAAGSLAVYFLKTRKNNIQEAPPTRKKRHHLTKGFTKTKVYTNGSLSH